MRIKGFWTLLFVIFGITLNSTGQILDPVKWSFSAAPVVNGETEIIARATIQSGWHIYALTVSADPNAIGPIPTTFKISDSKEFKLSGKPVEGKFTTHYDPNFDMDLNYFENTAVFRQKIKVLSDQPFEVKGILEYMACDDSQCIFPDPVPFGLTISAATGESKSNDNIVDGAAADDAPDSSDSGILKPVKWNVRTEKLGPGEYSVIFNAQMENGWHIYSQHLNSAEGPVPTSFDFKTSEKMELNGVVIEGKPTTEYDRNFQMNLSYFNGSADFVQKIKVGEEPLTIECSVGFMSCNDESCLPPETLYYRINLPSGVVALYNPDDTLTKAGESSVFRYLLPGVNMSEPLVTDCGSITSAEPDKGSSLWQLFVLGFLGGLVALLTPCVFPMIPLTVSFFTKGSQSRKQGLSRAGIYGLFIFLIYLALSMPFHVFDQIDENILNNISTNVPLNIFFFVIFVVFAISFFGYFEITLPSGLANRMDSASNTGGLIGSFFMALTLAIVSFSCTGPILGSLLAGSLSKDGGAVQLTAGMGGFGLALGIPFALFAAFPGMMKSLPKSGGWLNSVKVVLGFVELALALKFLSQADLVDHWNVLKYELFMALWIIIFALMALYIFGVIRFPHDSKLKKLSLFRIGFGVLIISWTIYLVSGFRYDQRYDSFKSLSLLSGLAPPVGYSWIHPRVCPHNLDCEHDYELALERSKRENKPLFIDFTGYACVNCRKMEEHVWIEPDVLEILSRDFIVVSLYVDDRKELPKELQETYTSMRTGITKNIKTYGDRWAAFQIETFNSNAQPLYGILTPDEKLVNNPVGYTPDKEQYKQWLICGRDAANKYSSRTAAAH